MFTAAAAALLRSGALTAEAVTATLAHLASVAATGTDVLAAHSATVALLEHLAPDGPATAADVDLLRRRGNGQVAVAAAAHRHTPAAAFRAALTGTPALLVATATNHTTDPRRLQWLLERADPASTGTADLLTAAADHPGRRSAAATFALVDMLNRYQHHHADPDLAHHVLADSDPAVQAPVEDAVAAIVDRGRRVHPSVADALLFRTAPPPSPLLLRTLAAAAAADVTCGAVPTQLVWAEHPLAVVLTSTAPSPAHRVLLAEHARTVLPAGQPLWSLLAGPDPADPACVLASTDPVALNALAEAGWRLPLGHLVRLAGHPLLTTRAATAAVLSASVSADAAAALLAGADVATGVRALLWLHQPTQWRLPLQALAPADVNQVLRLCADGEFLRQPQAGELAAYLGGLGASGVLQLPWRGVLAVCHTSPPLLSTLAGLLAPLMDPARLALLGALETFDGTVADALGTVQAATTR